MVAIRQRWGFGPANRPGRRSSTPASRSAAVAGRAEPAARAVLPERAGARLDLVLARRPWSPPRPPRSGDLLGNVEVRDRTLCEAAQVDRAARLADAGDHVEAGVGAAEVVHDRAGGAVERAGPDDGLLLDLQRFGQRPDRLAQRRVQAAGDVEQRDAGAGHGDPDQPVGT